MAGPGGQEVRCTTMDMQVLCFLAQMWPLLVVAPASHPMGLLVLVVALELPFPRSRCLVHLAFLDFGDIVL